MNNFAESSAGIGTFSAGGLVAAVGVGVAIALARRVGKPKKKQEPGATVKAQQASANTVVQVQRNPMASVRISASGNVPANASVRVSSSGVPANPILRGAAMAAATGGAGAPLAARATSAQAFEAYRTRENFAPVRRAQAVRRGDTPGKVTGTVKLPSEVVTAAIGAASTVPPLTPKTSPALRAADAPSAGKVSPTLRAVTPAAAPALNALLRGPVAASIGATAPPRPPMPVRAVTPVNPHAAQLQGFQASAGRRLVRGVPRTQPK